MEFNRLQVWENKIKIDIKDTGWEGVDWIYLAGVGAKLGGGGGYEHGNEFPSFKKC